MSLTSYKDFEHLTLAEKDYLNKIFKRFNGFPNLEQIWRLIDEVWTELGCDQYKMDDKKIILFYQHPVWILNGFFIEQHSESIYNIKEISNYIQKQNPQRILDFGGGFGNLARLLGKSLPGSQIEIFDPYPSKIAIFLVSSLKNVKFVKEFSGLYDFMIATDVFEHLDDPINSARNSIKYLRYEGQYLIANCFEPVMLCHLPKLFHFNYSWNFVMQELGFKLGKKVAHGRVFHKVKDFDEIKARKIAKFSSTIYPIINKIPRGKNKIGSFLTKIYLKFL